VHRKLHPFAVSVFSHTCAYSIGDNSISDNSIGVEEARRVFADSIATNPHIALVDLEGINLAPYVDMLGVSTEFQDSRTILAHVHVQRTIHRRVKSARGGIR
jgi:hypothetical protein